RYAAADIFFLDAPIYQKASGGVALYTRADRKPAGYPCLVLHRPLFQIKFLSRRQEVIFLPVMILVVIDAHLALADDLELISMNHDGGAFVEADSEQFRMGSDHRHQIIFSMTSDHVLINGRFLQQAETLHMRRRDHDGVVSIGIS